MHESIANMMSLGDRKPEGRAVQATAFLPDYRGLRTPLQPFCKIAKARDFLLTANA
jgi:hypothetical protein